MERFIGTDTASFELFHLIHLRNWDICHVVGPTFVSLCSGSVPWDWNHCVILISVSLSFWKRWRWPDRNFLRYKKNGPQFSILSPCTLLCVLVLVALTPTWCTIFWITGAPWQFCATSSGKSAGNDFWINWQWISIFAMLCAFKNFITDRTSQSARNVIKPPFSTAATMLLWELWKPR